MAKKKKKIEYSKIIMAVILIYGIANGVIYNIAMLQGNGSADPTLAVQCVITIIGAFVSYCIYQFGCKNSRNRYHVDENGEPWKEKLSDED